MIIVLILLFFSTGAAASENLLEQIQQYRQQGQAEIAIHKLQQALQETTHQNSFDLKYELIQLYIATQQLQQAHTLALQQLDSAKPQPIWTAKTWAQLGKIAIAQQQSEEAIQYYLRALHVEFEDDCLKNKILLNLAQLDKQYFSSALESSQQLKKSVQKAEALIILAKQKNEIALYQQALQLSQQLNEPHLKSMAFGYMGEYYQQNQYYDEALQLLESALFFSQHRFELSYRWQWRKAQIFIKQQKIAKALQYYQFSIQNIEKVRTALLLGYIGENNHFEQFVKPVYFELIDILLKQASQYYDKKQEILKQVIEILENYKSMELENYFQDTCVTTVNSTVSDIENDAAIFYPILLNERVELLLLIQGEISQFTVKEINIKDLTWLIQRFTMRLDTRTAQKLYQWLIAPVLDTLVAKQIETLVIVPHDILYTLPFAALYDGEHYLIEQYALAVTPSLELTYLQSNPYKNYKPLVGGVSESIKPFPALPYVEQELEQIDLIWDKKQVLKNTLFQFDVISKSLKQQSYNLLHFATHTKIMPQVKESFLLTYGGKINLDQLEQLVRQSQLKQQPIELLTLSACQTAKTDNGQKAALGIAGLAVKSGALSVLASLWVIDDAATAKLISAFYQQLVKKQITKAQALQSAQLKLMQLTTYRHPRYWSGFILIGNWL